LDAGAVQPDFEDFPIQRIVDRLSSEFSRQARQKNLLFSASCSEVVVRSDPNLLSEIIQNLVSNAIHYTASGSIEMSCHEADGRLHLSVKDTGIGIAPDQVEQIFQEFHQIKSPGQDKEGFGLGLAIVRRLSDLLEHEISVQSVPGEGSVFTVSLPVASAAQAKTAPSAETTVDDLLPAASGVIVLIEDDTQVANAWTLLLEAEGFEVLSAASARDAHAAVQHLDAPPQLIISDFHLLHGSTGVQAVAEIRQQFDRIIPAFIVSGDTSRMVQDARTTENCAIMNKPVNTERLLRAAKTAIATGIVPPD
jgi:CheY-like chemotaxis protein/anti-sigma regulatory factor (Ser/Thr protein kinase)